MADYDFGLYTRPRRATRTIDDIGTEALRSTPREELINTPAPEVTLSPLDRPKITRSTRPAPTSRQTDPMTDIGVRGGANIGVPSKPRITRKPADVQDIGIRAGMPMQPERSEVQDIGFRAREALSAGTSEPFAASPQAQPPDFSRMQGVNPTQSDRAATEFKQSQKNFQAELNRKPRSLKGETERIQAMRLTRQGKNPGAQQQLDPVGYTAPEAFYKGMKETGNKGLYAAGYINPTAVAGSLWTGEDPGRLMQNFYGGLTDDLIGKKADDTSGVGGLTADVIGEQTRNTALTYAAPALGIQSSAGKGALTFGGGNLLQEATSGKLQSDPVGALGRTAAKGGMGAINFAAGDPFKTFLGRAGANVGAGVGTGTAERVAEGKPIGEAFVESATDPTQLVNVFGAFGGPKAAAPEAPTLSRTPAPVAYPVRAKVSEAFRNLEPEPAVSTDPSLGYATTEIEQRNTPNLNAQDLRTAEMEQRPLNPRDLRTTETITPEQMAAEAFGPRERFVTQETPALPGRAPEATDRLVRPPVEPTQELNRPFQLGTTRDLGPQPVQDTPMSTLELERLVDEIYPAAPPPRKVAAEAATGDMTGAMSGRVDAPSQALTRSMDLPPPEYTEAPTAPMLRRSTGEEPPARPTGEPQPSAEPLPPARSTQQESKGPQPLWQMTRAEFESRAVAQAGKVYTANETSDGRIIINNKDGRPVKVLSGTDKSEWQSIQTLPPSERGPAQADFINRVASEELGGLVGDHRNAVEKALARGENVPPEVLAAYPDLVAPKPPAQLTRKPAQPTAGLPDQPTAKMPQVQRASGIDPTEQVQAKIEALPDDQKAQLKTEMQQAGIGLFELRDLVSRRASPTPMDISRTPPILREIIGSTPKLSESTNSQALAGLAEFPGVRANVEDAIAQGRMPIEGKERNLAMQREVYKPIPEPRSAPDDQRRMTEVGGKKVGIEGVRENRATLAKNVAAKYSEGDFIKAMSQKTLDPATRQQVEATLALSQGAKPGSGMRLDKASLSALYREGQKLLAKDPGYKAVPADQLPLRTAGSVTSELPTKAGEAPKELAAPIRPAEAGRAAAEEKQRRLAREPYYEQLGGPYVYTPFGRADRVSTADLKATAADKQAQSPLQRNVERYLETTDPVKAAEAKVEDLKQQMEEKQISKLLKEPEQARHYSTREQALFKKYKKATAEVEQVKSGELPKQSLSEKLRAKADQLEADARAYLNAPRERGGSEAGSAPILSDIAAYTQIGAAKLLRAGAKGLDYATFAAEMSKEFGEKVKEKLPEIYERARIIASSVGKEGEAVQTGAMREGQKTGSLTYVKNTKEMSPAAMAKAAFKAARPQEKARPTLKLTRPKAQPQAAAPSRPGEFTPISSGTAKLLKEGQTPLMPGMVEAREKQGPPIAKLPGEARMEAAIQREQANPKFGPEPEFGKEQKLLPTGDFKAAEDAAYKEARAREAREEAAKSEVAAKQRGQLIGPRQPRAMTSELQTPTAKPDTAMPNAQEALFDTGRAKTPALKVASNFIKANLLTKISSALADITGTNAYNVARDIIEKPTSAAADVAIPRIARMLGIQTEGRRTVTTAGVKGTLDSYVAGLTEGWKEAKKAFGKGGLTAEAKKRLEVEEIYTGERLPNKALDGFINSVFRGRSAADKFAFQYTLNRAIKEQAKLMELNGGGKVKQAEVIQKVKDFIADKPMDAAERAEAKRILDEATVDAADATLNGENWANDLIGKGKAKLWEGGTGKQIAAFLFDRVAPFTRVPTNAIFQAVSPLTAFGKGVGATYRTAKSGKLTSTDQRLIAEAMGKGLFGTAMYGAGLLWATQGGTVKQQPYNPLEQEEQDIRAKNEAANRQAGSLRIPGTDTYIDSRSLGTMGAMFMLGAQVYEDATKKDGGVGEVAKGAYDTLALNTPAARGFLEVGSAIGTGRGLARFASKAVQDATPIAGASGLGEFSGITGALTGKTALERETPRAHKDFFGSVSGGLQENIPFVRESLPAKRTAFGETRQMPVAEFIDPFKTRTAKNTPTIKALDRLGVGLSKLQPKEGETPQAFESRATTMGTLYKRNLDRVTGSGIYDRATRDIQEKMVDRTRAASREGNFAKPGEVFKGAVKEGPEKLKREREQAKKLRKLERRVGA